MKGSGLICVAGIVGVGKTTLAENLCEVLGGRLIREAYDRNPFLAGQYEGRSDAALASQLFFLLSRHDQLDADAITAQGACVADYVYEKDRIFARLQLEPSQFVLYEQVAGALAGSIAAPEAVIYLSGSDGMCLERIGRRGRSFEKSITAGWLERLGRAYEELFAAWQICPVLRLDAETLDLREREVACEIVGQLEGILRQDWVRESGDQITEG